MSFYFMREHSLHSIHLKVLWNSFNSLSNERASIAWLGKSEGSLNRIIGSNNHVSFSPIHFLISNDYAMPSNRYESIYVHSKINFH